VTKCSYSYIIGGGGETEGSALSMGHLQASYVLCVQDTA
jgi:hypothetical protein